jgi:hypothetical protein
MSIESRGGAREGTRNSYRPRGDRRLVAAAGAHGRHDAIAVYASKTAATDLDLDAR